MKKCKVSTIVIAAVSFVTLFILIFMLCGSFMSYQEVTSHYGNIYTGGGEGEYAVFHIIPSEFSVNQYYKALLETPDYLYKFWNSILLTLPILIGVVIVSTLGGYGFAKFQFPLKNLFFFLFILVIMLPYQVMMVPNFMVMDSIGLIGNRWSIILPNIFTPFGTFLIYQFMRRIPNDILESARIDGAGEFRVFIKVILPQAAPAIASLAMLNIIDTWSMIEQPLVFLQDPEKNPLSVALAYINTSNIGIAFVCGVVFLIPLMLVFLMGKDKLVDGISNSVI
jgi:multiple sugar transport system permease protein